ncbi:MAG TPA: ATP-binding protein [Roseiflexaceae bacterium]|nr:ATP-binding protein [Roseiflexaceae bacterium]
MNLEEFTHQVRQAHERAAMLNQGQHSMRPQDLLPVAIEDLSTALEELRAAEDELRIQHTALDRAHRRLEQERRYYQELFEAVPDAYLVTDVQGVIQEANHAAASLMQTPQRFLIGKPIALFVADHDVRAFRDQMAQLRRSENDSEWVLHIQPRRGQAQPVTARVSVAYDWQGMALSLRWLLRNHNGHAHQAGSSDQEAPQRALRLRDALVQSAVHELRDCLTPIYGYADYMQRLGEALSGADPRIARMLRAISSQGLRIEQLLTALLDWSILDHHQGGPQFERFDLAALASQTVDRIRYVLAGQPIELCGEAISLPVEADRNRIDQALHTLLQRAVRISPSDMPVRIRLGHEPGWALITVRDHGPPLLPVVAATLQQPHHDDADDLLTVKTLGVGLYVARATIALHQGTIAVACDGLQGTTITVRLPAAED